MKSVAREIALAVKAAGGKLSFATKDKGFKIGNRAITTLRAGRDVKWVLGKHDELKALCRNLDIEMHLVK